MKKLTTNEVIDRFRAVHGDRFDYSLVNYKKATEKVEIVCREHGKFLQLAHSHLAGSGCPTCGTYKTAASIKSNTEDFIEKSNKIHGHKYNYSETDYIKARVPVKIICPKHGLFYQKPVTHLSGCGCPECGKVKISCSGKSNTEEFINKAIIVHGNKYDYSKSDYDMAIRKIIIICPVHGEFLQSPNNHLMGRGCPVCAIKSTGDRCRSNIDEFIERAKDIHGPKYDYSKSIYVDANTKLSITCLEHGTFEQTPASHILAAQGCPLCGRINASTARTLSTDTFIDRANLVHGGKYDYSNSLYKKSKTSVRIICAIHGPFMQSPEKHLSGQGCPSCANKLSFAEQELFDTIAQHFPDAEQRNRSLIAPKELDIVVPSKNLAIEYNGLYWHSEAAGKDRNYHKEKTDACKQKGYRLIHIWEDDDLEMAKKLILHALGISNDAKVYARKCEIKPISKDVSKEFLDEYHPQGAVNATVHIGTFFQDKLIAVTAFGKPFRSNLYEHELKRHASSKNLVGGLGKVVKYYDRNYMSAGEKLGSLCDLSRFDGKSYELAGFSLDTILPPDYQYAVKGKRVHKSRYQKSGIRRLLSEYYRKDLTERQMMESAGIPRIWDCGKARYLYEKTC